MVRLIGELYAIEAKAAKTHALGTDEWREYLTLLRQTESKAVLAFTGPPKKPRAKTKVEVNKTSSMDTVNIDFQPTLRFLEEIFIKKSLIVSSYLRLFNSLS